MKICNQCNEAVPDQANFCTNCGSADFRTAPYSINQTANNGNGAVNFPYNNNAQPNYSYTPSSNFNIDSPEYKKTKKKKEITAGIIAAAVVAVCIAAIAVANGKAPKNASSITFKDTDITRTDFSATEVEETEIPYCKGNLIENVYSSEWADLRFTMTDEWQEAPESAYETYKDENTTCDFYAVRYDGSLLAVVVIDCSGYSSWRYSSEKSVFEEYIDGISAAMTLQETPEIRSEELGGQTYLCADMLGEQNGVDVCFTSYMRMLGRRVLFVNITSSDTTVTHKIASEISAY